MRLLVFGSRHWDDYHMLGIHIHGYNHAYPQLTIVEGEADGADVMGRWYVERNPREGLDYDAYPAKWMEHDLFGSTPVSCMCRDLTKRCWKAGHRRNQRQLDSGLDFAVGAKDNFDYSLKRGGTEDMYKRLIEARVPVALLSHGPSPRPQPTLLDSL